MSFAMEYNEGDNGIAMEDFRSTFSDGFNISTRYSANGDVAVLPITTNLVFEILRIEFRGISTRPSENVSALEVSSSTSSSASMANLVEMTTS